MYDISYEDFKQGIYNPLETMLDLGLPIKAHKRRYRKDSDDFYYEFELKGVKIGSIIIDVPYATTWENELLPQEFVEAVDYIEKIDSVLKQHTENQTLEFVLSVDYGNSHWCNASLYYYLALNGEEVRDSSSGFYREIPNEEYILALSGLFPEKYNKEDYKEKYHEENKLKRKQECIKLLSEKVYPLIKKAQSTGEKDIKVDYEYDHYTEYAMCYLDKQYRKELVFSDEYIKENTATYIISW